MIHSKRIPVHMVTARRAATEYTPEQRLANAIVAYAAMDYINALLKDNTGMIKSCERFFKSELYTIYTQVDSRLMMELCHKKAEELKARGVKKFTINRREKLSNER